MSYRIISFMPVSVMQIRIVRMLMRYRTMSMQMRMPLAIRNNFTSVRMGMMPIGMLMVMDVFHDNMSVPVFMRIQIGDNNSKSQKSNRNEMNPLEWFVNKQIR